MNKPSQKNKLFQRYIKESFEDRFCDIVIIQFHLACERTEEKS